MIEEGRAVQGFMRQTVLAKSLDEPIRCIVISGGHGEGSEGKGKSKGFNPTKVNWRTVMDDVESRLIDRVSVDREMSTSNDRHGIVKARTTS